MYIQYFTRGSLEIRLCSGVFQVIPIDLRSYCDVQAPLTPWHPQKSAEEVSRQYRDFFGTLFHVFRANIYLGLGDVTL